MECICSVCGKTFNRKKSLIERARNPVCSRECANILKHREWVETKCVICGKPLLRRKSRMGIRPNPTCSKKCLGQLTHNKCFDETISYEERALRKDRNYVLDNRKFKKEVFKRDNYTCVICHKVGNTLNAHHLNSFNWDIQNRYNIDNGVTLCEVCHKEFHKKYGQGDNTKEQFIEYANQSGN